MRAPTRVSAVALWLALAPCHGRTISFSFQLTARPSKNAVSDSICESVGSIWTAVSDKCLCEPCELCKFNFYQWACELIEPKAESESDGSDQRVLQPELDAQKWFLSEDEMTVSRGGVQRNALHLWTPNNNVSTYAATNEFFDALYEDLEATRAKDNVWISGWSFDDVSLKPQAEAESFNDTMFLTILQQMADRQVDFHFLAWTNFFENSQNIAFQKSVNTISPSPSQGGAYFIFDDRLPDATASHHQKTISIKRPQGIVSFIGGIDITWNRWDTLTHDQTEVRKRADIEREGGSHGWMDAHARIDGPAASDIAQNFLQRWNAKYKPLQDPLDPILPFKNPEYTSLADLNKGETLVERHNGHHAVQIVRTYSCKYPHYEDFAPQGEVSIFHSRLKAVKMAKNYVYIEDQYFVYVPQLLDALLEVLPHIQRVIIVTQPASSQTSLTGYRKYQWEMVKPLVNKYPNKVQVFRTKEERKIYIHSKLVIVDDVFVSISSSNWNRRSMTTDAEIGANVVDSKAIDTPDGIQVNWLARDYRVRKFMELSGKTYDEINSMKFLEAANALDAAAEETDTILAPFEVEENPSFLLFSDDVQDVLDPDVQCSS